MVFLMEADNFEIWLDKYLTAGSDLGFFELLGLDRSMTLKDLLAAWIKAWLVNESKVEVTSKD